MTTQMPPIPLFVNLVVLAPGRQVLLARYDREDERWMIPYADLEPYEHPDETARRGLEGLGPLAVTSLRMSDVLSFRGRAGWHVVFNYRLEAEGTPRTEFQTQWFPISDLPRTVHGRWEVDIIRRLSQEEVGT
jgi:ADP-ribose pyrophosphatase YjhB (NUDIX family)